jgi:predicted DNA-binding transcriptional regulator AlpA
MLSPNIRGWDETEIAEWIASRPREYTARVA